MFQATNQYILFDWCSPYPLSIFVWSHLRRKAVSSQEELIGSGWLSLCVIGQKYAKSFGVILRTIYYNCKYIYIYIYYRYTYV